MRPCARVCPRNITTMIRMQQSTEGRPQRAQTPPVCSKYLDCSLWKFQGAPRFLGLGVPAATHGMLERNAGRHGWFSVGVAVKINQAPRQGIKELRLPVSGRLAGKVCVDQADGGGTFAHRCCHPFD
jgi:hypothetical protein